MKVALLSDCYPPRMGGIESQVSDLAHQLVLAGHEVEVFTATAGADGATKGDVEDDGGVPVHRLSHPATLGVPINPGAASTIRRRLLAARVDVAHVHMGVVSPFAWDATRVVTGIGMPTVITWHCVLDKASTPWRWSGAIERWVERGALLSAVSSFAADGVRSAAPGQQVDVLPNGIDVTAWAPEEPRRPGDGPVHVVSALRLAPRKRPGLLLEVVEEVRRRTGADVRLDVYGEGPLRPLLEREIGSRDAGWARLHGRAARADLAARYHGSDIYLAPTRLEAFGIAALEARTAGLPVVALGGSGTRDVIDDGVSGILAADDPGLADAVARLVADPALRGRMAEHNATVPPRESWPTVVRTIAAEYRRAVGG